MNHLDCGAYANMGGCLLCVYLEDDICKLDEALNEEEEEENK